MKGTSVLAYFSSSSFVNELMFLPAKMYEPSVSLTFSSDTGPWQTAPTTALRSYVSLTTFFNSGCSGISTIGASPPGMKIASYCPTLTSDSFFAFCMSAHQAKLRDGSLPHDNIPATIPGSPGNGSACGVCGQPLANHQLMMLIPSGTTPIPLHTDCFE